MRHGNIDVNGMVTDIATNATGVSTNATSISTNTPAGTIMSWSKGSAPSGWLECDGSAVSRATYATLFTAIAETYGNGDGSTTFNVPDLRGKFLRGYDHGATTDPDAATRTDRGDATTGDNVGTNQAHAFQGHYHTGASLTWGATAGGSNISVMDNETTDTNKNNAKAPTDDGSNGTPSITSETRPVNVAVMFLIKA